MISKNQFFSIIFLLSLFPGQIVSCNVLKSADELACLFIMLLVGLDIVANGWKAIKRQMPLWIVLGVMFLYVIYSILFMPFNTPKYIVIDMVSQVKPFIPFVAVYSLGLKLTPEARTIARWLCIVNEVFMLIFYIWGRGQLILPFAHISYMGSITLISAMVYYYCSLDDDKQISIRDLIVVVGMLTFGLLCGRSKYFGEYIVIMALLCFYQPRMFSHITLKRLFVGLGILALIVVAAWPKINYYFIQGASDVLQSSSLEEMSEAFARPLLYYVGGLLLLDFFPFGPGLASFASYASSTNYSSLYYDYELNRVWGLSPSYSEFICDAYYPTLCQFGIVGVCLFIYFWSWIIRGINRNDRELGQDFRHRYVICFGLLAFVFIESVGSTFFIQGTGAQAMMLLALICTPYARQESVVPEPKNIKR